MAPGAQVSGAGMWIPDVPSAKRDALLATHVPCQPLPLPSFIYAQVSLLFGTLSQPLFLLS